MSGDTTLKNAAETIRRLNVGRATVPAGGPTDRVMRDAVTIIELLGDDAARLRSLAATFDSHLNRDKTYTGAQVAAMLREGEA